MPDEDFEDVVEKWLKELIDRGAQGFPLRLRRHQRVKGDSGNYHEIDFVVEGAVAPPENLTELMKAVEDAFKRLGEIERLYKEEKSLDRWVAYSKSLAEFNAAVDRLINSFRFDAKMLIEVKGVGWGGEEPTEQTYREHMLRAYACLGDYRNQTDKQKYVIVPYKVAKRGFNYSRYFESIGASLLSYNEPKDRSFLEQKMNKLKEELIKELNSKFASP